MEESGQSLVDIVAERISQDLKQVETEKPKNELVQEVATKIKKDLGAQQADSAEAKRDIENKSDIVDQVAEKLKNQFTFHPGQQKVAEEANPEEETKEEEAGLKKTNTLQERLKEAFTKPIIDEVSKQILEGVNKAPENEEDDGLDEELIDAVAQKMIRDLERAAEGEGEKSFKTNRESEAVVDAIMQKVKQDLAEAENDNKRDTIVDAVAMKVKKDLEMDNAEVENENLFNVESKDGVIDKLPQGDTKVENNESPAKENTAANSSDAKDKEEMVEDLGS